MEEGLHARLPLDWLSGIFTPNVLLDAGRPAEFVQLLNLLSEADGSLLDEGDVPALLAAFDCDRYFDGGPPR